MLHSALLDMPFSQINDIGVIEPDSREILNGFRAGAEKVEERFGCPRLPLVHLFASDRLGLR